MTTIEERTDVLRGVGAWLATAAVTPPAPALEEPTLAGAVLAAVRRLPAQALRWFPKADQGIAFQPKALLALLTYCYANENYAATDIENCMCRDASFRRLCQNEFPGQHLLRQFRRYNREPIIQCLADALRFLRSRRSVAMAAEPAVSPRGGARCAAPAGASEDTVTEARRRVETATFLDHMESEAD